MDVVLLDDDRDPVRIVSKVGIDRLGLLVGELGPDVIAIDAPPAWAPNGPWRERILAAQGVRTAELTTADRVDAALCALTGLLALEGKRFAPGDPKEGVIVLPAASLPARPFRPAPAEAHDEATLPLFRECA